MKLLPSNLFKDDYFGLSVTFSSLKAVAIGQDKKIKSSAQVALDPKVFSKQGIQTDQLAQALEELVTTGHFSSQYTAVCIPEYHSFTRSHTIPKIHLSEVTEALQWQIEKIFPLPKDEIYFDWKLLSQNGDSIRLLIVAMPKKTLDNLIQAFESAGIKPISFEPSASALTRILSLKPNQPTILVEINPHGSSATLIENQIATLTITSQFPKTGDNQDVKIALQNTSQSIQSLITFHNTKHTQAESLELLMTGESASQQMASWLSTYVNQQVNLLQIPDIPTHLHQAFAAANTSILPSETGMSVNLLPDKLRNLYEASRTYQKTATRFKTAGVLILIFLAISSFSFFIAVSRLNQAKAQLLALEQNNAQFSYNSAEVATLNKNSRVIIKLFPKKTSPVNTFEEITSITPNGVLVSNFTFDREKNSINIIGTAAFRTNLLELRNNLNNSQTLTNINVPLESLEKPADIDFSIKTTLKEPTNKQ